MPRERVFIVHLSSKDSRIPKPKCLILLRLYLYKKGSVGSFTCPSHYSKAFALPNCRDGQCRKPTLVWHIALHIKETARRTQDTIMSASTHVTVRCRLQYTYRGHSPIVSPADSLVKLRSLRVVADERQVNALSVKVAPSPPPLGLSARIMPCKYKDFLYTVIRQSTKNNIIFSSFSNSSNVSGVLHLP